MVLSHRILVIGNTRMAAKELIRELLDSIPVPV